MVSSSYWEMVQVDFLTSGPSSSRVACLSNDHCDTYLTVLYYQCHLEGRTVKPAVYSSILHIGNIIGLGSAGKLAMIVNRSEMLDPHLNWNDVLSTEWREPSTSLAYIQKAKPNALQPYALSVREAAQII
jgi:hypothetical protein